MKLMLVLLLSAGCASTQGRTPAQEWVHSTVKACEDQLGAKVWLSHVQPDGRFTLGGWTVSSSDIVGGGAALGVDVTTPAGRMAVNAALPPGLAVGGSGYLPSPDQVAAERVAQCVLRRQFNECERATGYKITPRALVRPEPATRAFSECLRTRYGTR